MRAETAAFARASFVPETVNGEHPETVGAGPAGPLTPLAKHGDGQDAHAVGGGAARGQAVVAADGAAVVAEVFSKATYAHAKWPQAVRARSPRARRTVHVLAGDGDGGGATARVGRDQGVAPLPGRVERLVQ
jgi:hypothetical protein